MPVGAYFGRGTPNTKGLFPEVWRGLGEKMLYCSEAYNDDVPVSGICWELRNSSVLRGSGEFCEGNWSWISLICSE